MCILRAVCPVDDGEDFLLFLGVHADAVQRLPGSAVRADERLVVRRDSAGALAVAPAAQRADL